MRTTIKILALTTIILGSTSVLADDHYTCKTEEGKDYTAQIDWKKKKGSSVCGGTRKVYHAKFKDRDANGVREVTSFTAENGASHPDIVSMQVDDEKADVMNVQFWTRDGSAFHHTCRKDK